MRKASAVDLGETEYYLSTVDDRFRSLENHVHGSSLASLNPTTEVDAAFISPVRFQEKNSKLQQRVLKALSQLQEEVSKLVSAKASVARTELELALLSRKARLLVLADQAESRRRALDDGSAFCRSAASHADDKRPRFVVVADAAALYKASPVEIQTYGFTLDSFTRWCTENDVSAARAFEDEVKAVVTSELVGSGGRSSSPHLDALEKAASSLLAELGDKSARVAPASMLAAQCYVEHFFAVTRDAARTAHGLEAATPATPAQIAIQNPPTITESFASNGSLMPTAVPNNSLAPVQPPTNTRSTPPRSDDTTHGTGTHQKQQQDTAALTPADKKEMAAMKMVAQNLLETEGATSGEVDFASPNAVLVYKSTMSAKDVTKLLTAFYSANCPEKIVGIPKMMENYEGKFDVLFQLLNQKYGKKVAESLSPQRSPSFQPLRFQHGQSKAQTIQMVREFYAAHAPEKVSEAQVIVERFEHDYAKLFDKLNEKYASVEEGKKQTTAVASPIQERREEEICAPPSTTVSAEATNSAADAPAAGADNNESGGYWCIIQ